MKSSSKVMAFVLAVWFIRTSFSFGQSENSINPSGIVIHHSALTAADFAKFPEPTDASVIDHLHESRGFSVLCEGHLYHIGYHYVILPDGTVQSGRPERCVGAHTLGHNDEVGICLIGNFSSVANPGGRLGIAQPTRAQIRSLVVLMKDLKTKYLIPCARIKRHQDLKIGTLCPGDRFPWSYVQEQIGCEN